MLDYRPRIWNGVDTFEKLNHRQRILHSADKGN